MANREKPQVNRRPTPAVVYFVKVTDSVSCFSSTREVESEREGLRYIMNNFKETNRYEIVRMNVVETITVWRPDAEEDEQA